MVIFGPSARIRVTATQAPAIAATMGMIQTSESRVCFLPTALESGTFGGNPSPSAMANLSRACRIPDQTRVKGLDAKHRQHHHRREEEQAGTRFHRHERLQLDERGGEGVDEDVDHRPAPDEADHAVE